MHTLSISATHVTVTKAGAATPCYHAGLTEANMRRAEHHVRLLSGYPNAMDRAVVALEKAEEQGCLEAKAALIELGY